MMIGMFQVWVDKLVRISAGLAMLLLLAAEEKVCPCLYTPPADPAAPQTAPKNADPLPATDSASDPTDGDEPTPEPLSLVAVLPDVLPVRWPGQPRRAALAETTGAYGGTVACGPRDRSGGNGPDTAAWTEPIPPWLVGFAPPALTGTIQPSNRTVAVRDPAVATILLRTGPPAA